MSISNPNRFLPVDKPDFTLDEIRNAFASPDMFMHPATAASTIYAQASEPHTINSCAPKLEPLDPGLSIIPAINSYAPESKPLAAGVASRPGSRAMVGGLKAKQVSYPQTIPQITPGGRFEMPEFRPPIPPQASDSIPTLPSTTAPVSSTDAFVVFLGINNSSGVFRHYQSTSNCVGADSLVPLTFKGGIMMGFMNFDAAVKHFQECLASGVIKLLKAPETAKTVYIVTKGRQPGVYRRR
ncbi:hypothetical protein BDP27DRAFT_1368662 [Rhodocollybia butyracea]|uniref:Uncharacterized protein n=1 Tax=Rhodocollybia butyracea TaxID=206335 RepID=A0A9P5PII0_9AGAR|nr:hypothetical protein BDP27DRAFT_1368662 [Rhodocollybia butyracea]